MKLFALTYLSDITREKFREFDEQSLEGKIRISLILTNRVCLTCDLHHSARVGPC